MTLKTDLETKDKEYAAKISERDFEDLVKTCIKEASGKSEKAIKAYLDVDKLKTSQNQKEDVANAIKALADAEESAFLFGDVVVDNIDTVGAVKKSTGNMSAVEKAFYERNPELKEIGRAHV